MKHSSLVSSYRFRNYCTTFDDDFILSSLPGFEFGKFIQFNFSLCFNFIPYTHTFNHKFRHTYTISPENIFCMGMAVTKSVVKLLEWLRYMVDEEFALFAELGWPSLRASCRERVVVQAGDRLNQPKSF